MNAVPELIRVRDAHRFDEVALAAYLAEHLPGFRGELTVRQFESGQSNPTFLLTAAGREYVMRKKPPGRLLRSAHQVEREYRVMTALARSDVPVPRTHLLCEDASVVGTPFYLMQRVEGRVVSDPSLPDFSRDQRRALYEHFVRVLAALHQVDPVGIGLESFGKPGDYCARQISRWSRQYAESKTEDIPEMEALIAWLSSRLPASDETCIVHGDYRIGNCILYPEQPRVAAVLDWELSTLGHPLADLAYCCQIYRVETAPGRRLSGLDLADLGIPSEEEFVARYCELAGRPDIENWNFYLVFVMFRSAAIMQGVYKRGLDGNASSERAREYGAAVRKLARNAWDLARG
jgi:aminoglycoside phosphotransferase (APT) family kinase protein